MRVVKEEPRLELRMLRAAKEELMMELGKVRLVKKEQRPSFEG